jgi:FkbM family methyltransferase
MSINQNFNEWSSIRGDETLMLDHTINENSHVVEVGGYKGVWASQIISKFNPYVYIFEPIQEYYSFLCEKFKDNPKVKIYKFGVCDKNESIDIFLIGDSSSIITNSDKNESIDIISFDKMVDMLNLKSIDLMQINIEGSEYNLLDFAISENYLNNIQKILIQFHTNVEDCVSRRHNIQSNLRAIGFSNIFDYPFIWEGWEKK